MFILLFRY